MPKLVRNPFTADDDRRMWSFLVERLKEGDRRAYTPKGLAIWKLYALRAYVDRSPANLQSRFARHLDGQEHRADLPLSDVIYLVRRLKIKLEKHQIKHINTKFDCNILIDANGLPAPRPLSHESMLNESAGIDADQNVPTETDEDEAEDRAEGDAAGPWNISIGSRYSTRSAQKPEMSRRRSQTPDSPPSPLLGLNVKRRRIAALGPADDEIQPNRISAARAVDVPPTALSPNLTVQLRRPEPDRSTNEVSTQTEVGVGTDQDPGESSRTEEEPVTLTSEMVDELYLDSLDRLERRIDPEDGKAEDADGNV